MGRKKLIFKSLEETYIEERNHLFNKYYNLWLQRYTYDIDHRQQEFINKKLWSEGKIGAFRVAHTEELGFAPFLGVDTDSYDYPVHCYLVNKNNNPTIPNKLMTIDEDVVICYILPNHKSIKELITPYINKILNVEMVIKQNLDLHRMPWLLVSDAGNAEKYRDLIERIMAGDTSIVLETADITALQVLITQAPYLIDKLTDYKKQVESELLQIIGLDNGTTVCTTEQNQTVDEVNSSNQLDNAFYNSININIEDFAKKCKEVLGVDIRLEKSQEEVSSIYEGKDQSSKLAMEDNNNEDNN